MAADTSVPAATGLLCALLSALCFSLKAIFVKRAYAYGVDPITLLAMRMLFALPFFIAMAVYESRRAASPLRGRDWFDLTLLGFFGYYAASYLDFLGLQYISAALERVLLFTYPAIVVLLLALSQGRAPEKRVLAALALSYTGVALAVLHDARAGGANLPLGAALVFGSSLSFAVYLLRCGEVLRRLGATRVTAIATGTACLMVNLQFALQRPVYSLVAQPWPVHAYSLAMALFCTVLPIWLSSVAIRRLGAGRVAIVSSLGPIMTLLLAALLLGEKLSVAMIAGAALVILGVRLISQGAAAPAARA